MHIGAPDLPEITVKNPFAGYPDIDVKGLQNIMRLDAAMGEAFFKEKILHAIDVVTPTLGFMPDFSNALNTRLYIRAVLHEAAALINDQLVDYDNTELGKNRVVNDKSGALRRVVNHLVADLKSRPRNRIALL